MSIFKFLDAYENTEEDRRRFFGRDREISALYDEVYKSELILIYGASGTGKTSLVLCGLGKKFSSTDWLPLYIRRGDHLVRSLEDGIHRRLKTPLPRVQFDARGERVPIPIDQRLKRLYLDYYKPIFLIFDQFEELYVSGTAEEQEAFYDQVIEILNGGVQCRIMIVMREEFIAQLSGFEQRLPNLFDHRFRLEKMTDANLKKVIEGTLGSVAGLQLEAPETTSQSILNNLKTKENERVELSNLQVYLDRLYRAELQRSGPEAPRRAIDPALVRRVGPLKNVMAEFLTEQLEKLERELSKKHHIHQSGVGLALLFEFVTTKQTKQVIEPETLVADFARKRNLPEEVVQYMLDFFQQARILRALDN